MKKVRTKEFNYNLNQSSANVVDYYEPNGQTLTEEELKHSAPETKVLTLGRDSDDASAYPALFKRDSLTQGHAMVDFWASGFDYNNPTLVDPSLFHTWFKIYTQACLSIMKVCLFLLEKSSCTIMFLM